MNNEPSKQEPVIGGGNSSQEASSSSAPEVLEELSKVASNPKKNMVIFGAMAAGFLFMGYSLFAPQIFNDPNKKPPKMEVAAKPDSVVTPAAEQDSAPPIPKLPEPPKLVTPTPPPPKPKVEVEVAKKSDAPSLPNVVEPQPGPPLPMPNTQVAPPAPSAPNLSSLPTGSKLGGSASEEEQKRINAKRKAPIHLVGGAGKSASPTGGPGGGGSDLEQYADFKKRGDLNYVLGQGKIIDVLTETAINSDFPGEVRAIVTRDVYSANGKVILIPKGTRVFGDFTVSNSGGYGRVDIKWKRIDLNTGYTVTLAGDAVDHLGRKGVQGVVDNKFTEQMANALLSTAFSIGIAAAIDKAVKPPAPNQGSANTALANNIQNTALSIFNDANAGDENTKVQKICSAVQNAIPDKTSSAFSSFAQACVAANGQVGAQPGQKLTAIMNSVTAASTSLLTSTTAAATPSHQQEAASQAIKDLTATMQGMMKQAPLTPTTTIDQGHPIKIYVGKDYLFPKEAVVRYKVLK